MGKIFMFSLSRNCYPYHMNIEWVEGAVISSKGNEKSKKSVFLRNPGKEGGL